LNSILVKNGNIIYPWGIVNGDILIIDGVVKCIGKSIEYNGVEKINAKGKIVLPGVVDIHVHMREPGLEYKDNFENGTRDAVQSGVTTVLDMPNTIPPVDSVERFRYKKSVLSNKAYCDFGLYGVIVDDNIEELEKLIDEGVIGFKVFLGPTTGDIKPPSLETLVKALSITSKHRVIVAFHAEEWSLVEYFTKETLKMNRSDPLVHLESRPPICEEIAIHKIGLIAKYVNAPVHIVHLSSYESVKSIQYFKEIGVDITCETNPHYLLLDIGDYEKYGSLIKVNPPIRGGLHRESLWRAIRNGVIDIIASDHAPHSVDEKTRDIWSASSGFPGVYTLLPLMLNSAFNNQIDLTMIPKLLSQNPAKRFRLYPRKGCLIPGCDGDIVIVDPGREWIIDKEKMYCKNKLTPFDKWRVRGYIEYTILRGTIVYNNGELIEKPIGKFLKPV